MTEPTTRTLDVPGAVLHYGSKRTDGADVTTPDEHADDLHRLISVLGAGPPGIFATSGGAVSALALAARHPGQVRRSSRTNRPVLPDRQALLAACTDIRQTCQGPGTTRLPGQNMPCCIAYDHDFGALRAASTRTVLGTERPRGHQR